MATDQSVRMARILANPRLYRHALLPNEANGDFPWHRYAYSARSSQVVCVSAFGTLRNVSARTKNAVVQKLITRYFPGMRVKQRPPRWDVKLEDQRRELLNEWGGTPSSIDVLLESSKGVVAIEAKYDADARSGFGGCGQIRSSIADDGTRTKESRCAGFFGPESDLKTDTLAWCRLENWERGSSPRLYWTIGRAHFRPGVFKRQSKGGVCPLRDSNFQLARNFLYAATLAGRSGGRPFGVLVVSPGANSARLLKEMADFKQSILQEQFHDRLQYCSYEDYVAVLEAVDDSGVRKLAQFIRTEILGRRL